MKKKNWPIVRFGDFVSLDKKQIIYYPSEKNYIGMEDVESETGNILRFGPNEKIKGMVFEYSNKHVLYGKLRPYLNKVVLPEEAGACSTEMMPLLPKENCVREWLAYLLRSKKFVALAMSSSSGSRMPRADMKILLDEKFPLPPVEIQRRIAFVLDEAMRLLKKREEADKKMEAFAPALFHKMFGDPGKNEKGWEVKKLGEVSDIVAGSTPNSGVPDFWKGDINWVTPAEMKSDSFYITETERKITKQGFEDCSTKMFPRGSVILSTRAPIGKVAISGVEMCSNQGIKALITKPYLNNVYLFWWLKQRADYLNSLGSGATFKELSSTALKSVSIPVPPLELQEKFADRITEMRAFQELQNESRKKLEEVFEGMISRLI
ncbi:MAG: restriction endonuclease subunit S [Alphaproteobacteria bacterium]|nr:restriction endonuclease subunit S [Alphaproteobacteria bacterium]